MPTATIFKEIPSHSRWKTARDAAGGKSNMVSSVNVGKLLDAFDNAGANAKARADALEKLRLGLISYTANEKVKKIDTLLKTAMSIFELVKKEQLAAKQAKDLGLTIGLLIADGYKRLEEVKRLIQANEIDKAGNVYEKFYDGIGRGVGQKLQDGKLRQDWTKAHTTLPTRENISGCKQDLAKKKKLMETGVPGYKAALDKLLKDAQAEGIEVKLS
jgi:hypothetical protein